MLKTAFSFITAILIGDFACIFEAVASLSWVGPGRWESRKRGTSQSGIFMAKANVCIQVASTFMSTKHSRPAWPESLTPDLHRS